MRMNTPVRSALLLAILLCGGCGSQVDYIAPPFFSENAFREVRPGLKQAAVRDLLGYPVFRFGPVEVPGKGFKITWNYALPASWEPPVRCRSFAVTFGPDGLVSSTLSCETSWEATDGTRDSIHAIQQCRRRLGNLVLTRPDGSTNMLFATQPGLYVLLLDGDGADSARLNPGPNWLEEALPGLLQNRTIAGVKHLYIGHRPESYGELVGRLPAQTARECYVSAEPELTLTVWDKDSRLLLYQAGAIWSVPGITSNNGELAAEDQKWLVHRLGTQPTAPRKERRPFSSRNKAGIRPSGTRIDLSWDAFPET